MLIPLTHSRAIYEQIQNEAVAKDSQITIFVAWDADSLAAAKILTLLFLQDHIQYQLIPVGNYSDLNETLANTQYGLPLFINCGGAIDLSEYINDSTEYIYVFDAHRPIAHNNIHSSKVILIDDAHMDKENCPSNQDFADLEVDSEDEMEIMRQEYQSDSDEEVQLGMKRKAEEIKESRVLRQEKRSRIEQYYSGSYYGQSVAGLFYSMARQMNREDNTMLWMWLVGVADQLIHNRSDRSQYERTIGECQTEVIKLNQDAFSETQEIEGICIDQKDLRLMLLKHWTLYDSMYYCNYIASKIGIWKEPGKRKLLELLAHIGIPLQECKQVYKYMNNDYKSTLNEKMMSISDKFGLDDIFVISFVRKYNSKLRLSAMDVVYACTALLESPMSLEEKDMVEETNGDIGARQKWLQNFWWAYDSLLSDEIILRGIQISIELQKAVVDQGTSLIEKRAVNPTAEFRYAVIATDVLAQTKFFHHPLAIQKLTYFLMEAYKEQKINQKAKPMVLCVLNSANNTYLVAGVTGNHEERNEFVNKFKNACVASKVRYRSDSFESCLYEIQREDFPAFLEQLTYSGNNM